MNVPHVALGVFLESESFRAVVARKWLLPIMGFDMGGQVGSCRKFSFTLAAFIGLLLLVGSEMVVSPSLFRKGFPALVTLKGLFH